VIVQSFLSITHNLNTLIRCPRSHCHCFGNAITVGSPSLPGLTPKAIDELFRLVQERVHVNVRVTTYFVELYNDNLVDLFWVLDNKGKAGEFRVLLSILMHSLCLYLTNVQQSRVPAHSLTSAFFCCVYVLCVVRVWEYFCV
jgi:hypothetical protein